MPLFRSARQALPLDQVDVDPHAWRLPSAYSTSSTGDKATVIPHPKIFTNATFPRELEAGNYPDVSHAAVHLALLECFRNLRLSASALDVEAHYPPIYEEKPGTSTPPKPTRLLASQRWDLLIRLAIDRFAAWWSNIDRVLIHAAAYAHHARDTQLAREYLPPLDVLLVWYAFMLHWESYRAACIGRERDVPRLRQLRFPWAAIHDAIDMETMQFELPRGAQNLFSTLSGQSSDILTCLENPPAYADMDTLPIGINLFAVVKEHNRFFDEAHSWLWIRAPALKGTLTRASAEYFELQRRGMAAKTMGSDIPFGVDLLWRTHRLFPEHYELCLQPHGGQSGDTRAQMIRDLGLGSKWVGSDVFPELCFCWTCERIRDDLPTFVHTPLTQASCSLLAPLSPMQDQLSSLSSDQLRHIQDDLGFYHAVESARRSGNSLPTRPPTVAEKEAERISKDRQKEAGFLPGLHECVEVMPDGRRKIRRQKYASPWLGLPFV